MNPDWRGLGWISPIPAPPWIPSLPSPAPPVMLRAAGSIDGRCPSPRGLAGLRQSRADSGRSRLSLSRSAAPSTSFDSFWELQVSGEGETSCFWRGGNGFNGKWQRFDSPARISVELEGVWGSQRFWVLLRVGLQGSRGESSVREASKGKTPNSLSPESIGISLPKPGFTPGGLCAPQLIQIPPKIPFFLTLSQMEGFVSQPIPREPAGIAWGLRSFIF